MEPWNLSNLWKLPDLWKLSDLTMFALASALAFNILVILLFLSHRVLEQKMNMHNLSRLLKVVLLYSLFLLPIITGLNLFFQTYKRVWVPEGDDAFGYGMAIGNQSISTSTGYGNHWIFILLFAVWLLGVIYSGLRYIIKDYLFLKKLERFNDGSPDTELEGFMVELKRELKVKSFVALGINSMISEPFVTGFLHPRLFFPAKEMEKSAREMMLKHELIHCRNKDYFYRRLMFFTCTLYWYNPVIYRFADYFIEVNEMACDEKVLERASDQERYYYAALLAGLGKNGVSLPNAVSLTGHTKNELVRRIENISQKKGKTSQLFFAVLMAAVFVCCPLTTFAASSGVSKAQAVFLDAVTEKSKEAVPEIIIIQQTDPAPLLPLAEAAMQIAAWGEDLADITMNGKQSLGIGAYTLPGGSVVNFWLIGENDTIKFRDGYESSSGSRTYITSADDLMSYSFPTPKAGTYIVFIEGTTTVTLPVFGYIAN